MSVDPRALAALDDLGCAPRAARRIALALADPGGKEVFFGQINNGISNIVFSVEPTVLIPALGNGNMAVSIEIADLVIDGDFTIHGLASIARRGREQIAAHASCDPEAYLWSLCEEDDSLHWAQIAEIAVALAIKDPDAALALEGRKEWVSIVATVNELGGKRLSVTSGSGLRLGKTQQPNP